MSTSCILIETGQCGNQLGYTLLDSLYDHISPPSSRKEFDKYFNTDTDIFFRKSRDGSKLYSRSVCLDTEPKVINECLTRARQKRKWELDPKSVAYLHGGTQLYTCIMICLYYYYYYYHYY